MGLNAPWKPVPHWHVGKDQPSTQKWSRRWQVCQVTQQGVAGRSPPPRRWDPGLQRARRNLEGTHGQSAQKGGARPGVIYPHVEEVQAPKPDMGTQSEANAMIGHPKLDKADRDA
jgi:hypothetical protein